MLRHLLGLIVSPAVMKDADRLIDAHGGAGAVYLARHAAIAAREQSASGHWTRVLAEIEFRLRRSAGRMT